MSDIQETKSIWERMHDRVKNLEMAMTQVSEISKEEMEKVLHKRALELAKEIKDVGLEKKTIQLLTFTLAMERYGFDIRYVREIRKACNFTIVPCTFDFIVGVINLRGQILSVIDIRKFLGLEKVEVTNSSRIVVVEIDEIEMGIIVDAVEQIVFVDLDKIEPPLSTLGGVREEFIDGIYSQKDSVLIIIDLLAIIRDKKLVVDEEV